MSEEVGQESSARNRGAGKWGDPTFPKTGWTLIDIEDLDEPSFTCEMCEYTVIRYVHTIRHDTVGYLRAGCICAGQLTGDNIKHKDGERQLKDRAERWLKWRDKTWKMSRNHNFYLKYKSHIVTVFRSGEKWKYVASLTGISDRSSFSRNSYDSADDAMDASFEFFYPHKITY